MGGEQSRSLLALIPSILPPSEGRASTDKRSSTDIISWHLFLRSLRNGGSAPTWEGTAVKVSIQAMRFQKFRVRQANAFLFFLASAYKTTAQKVGPLPSPVQSIGSD